VFATVLQTLFGPLLSGVFTTIDKMVPDADLAQKLKGEINTMLMQFQSQLLDSATKIILAEAQGSSWLQRNWRPLLMLCAITILWNNYIIAPYLSAMFHVKVMLEMPADLWTLLNLGVGGYVVGKSAEQIATNVAGMLKK
jgi:hypothetical protein